jgi:phospholipid/cholesterol/gamma-HCH transport system substrate-binding protein
MWPRRPKAVAEPIMGAPARARAARARNFRIGVNFYVLFVLLFVLLAAKAEIQSLLSGGKTITAEFADSYKLRENDSTVKVAGLTVGNVSGISRTAGGTTIVTMKVDEEALAHLGSAPSARIEPRTILGGRYAIELKSGGGHGEFEGRIPLERTAAPTELDVIAEALPTSARQSLQRLAGTAGDSLEASDDAMARLLKSAPEVLAPGADVLKAAQGRRPATDLPSLVTDLNTTADVLGRDNGQLAGIARNLSVTSDVLADNSGSIGQTVANLPETLRSTKAGMTGLDQSVTALGKTAKDLRPVAPTLAHLVGRLEPMLREAQPLMADLKPLLRDARPAVEQLVPTARGARTVLSDIRGPVLDRVNGPVSDFVLNPWKGTGPYKGGAGGYMADHKFYEELAYMATNIDRASMSQDGRGSTLAFQAGVGLGSLSGLPFDMNSLATLALDQAGITGSLRTSIFKNLGLAP